jgi:hypothetical protein
MSVFANNTALVSAIAQVIAFKLIPKNTDNKEIVTIALLPGFKCDDELKGKYVQSESFKAVDNEFVEFTAESEINLTGFQDYEYFKQSLLNEVRVKVLSESKQLTQGQECPLVLKTVDRLGNEGTQVIEGKYSDELKSFIYEVGQAMTLDKVLEYSVLPGIEIEISLVY